MAENSPHKIPGCGLFSAIFGGFWAKRTTPAASLPPSENNSVKSSNDPSSKRNRNSEKTLKATSREAPSQPKIPSVNNQNQARTNNQTDPRTVKTSGPVPGKPAPVHGQQAYANQGRKKPSIGISGELESMITDHQRNKGKGEFVRASSGNVMLYGNLGNLRQGGAGNATPNTNVIDYLPKTAKEETSSSTPNRRISSSTTDNAAKKNSEANRRISNSTTDNIAKKNNEVKKSSAKVDPSLCRAISTRMDPETLKIMGNEDYKNGNFAEALSLYDAAISIDPNKAAYRSNKSAALTALGHLLEAVFECREAIRIEPHFHRAHQRLANLYLRLGDADKATYHCKHSGPDTDQELFGKARNLQLRLTKCTEARRLRNYNAIIKETGLAISTGADSAPQIYSLQAEALLKLNRHQDADEALSKISHFDDDDLTKFFGPVGAANLFVVRAQVDMAVGRFEDAWVVIQRAAQLDSNNKEVNMVLKKVQVVSAAREKGNELFKASRLSEACSAYKDGLDCEPYNSILLCNRAACYSRLGQFDNAAKDCSAALNVRPSYSKARLRRADCNAKMQKWEASIRDYEILLKESPEDEELKKALSEAQKQLKNHRGA